MKLPAKRSEPVFPVKTSELDDNGNEERKAGKKEKEAACQGEHIARTPRCSNKKQR
jgi:hypothetical protein